MASRCFCAALCAVPLEESPVRGLEQHSTVFVHCMMVRLVPLLCYLFIKFDNNVVAFGKMCICCNSRLQGGGCAIFKSVLSMTPSNAF